MSFDGSYLRYEAELEKKARKDTFMDYLVTLNGAGSKYVGIVGGTFQLLIMCASLVFGGWTDHSRKYYFVTIAMLVFGALRWPCATSASKRTGGGTCG